MKLNKLMDYLVLNKHQDDVNFKFDFNLMDKFERDLELDFDSQDQFEESSTVLYLVDGNRRNYSFDCSTVSPVEIAMVKADIFEIEGMLNVFPIHVFDALKDQKVKLYLTDYDEISLEDEYFVEKNKRLETNKIIPLRVGFNINLVEAITDSVNDCFGDFISSDYFKKIYEEERLKLTDILRDDEVLERWDEIEDPNRFLAWSMYSYYSCYEEFCYRCGKTYEYVKDIDKSLEKLYRKPENVFTKSKVKK